MLTDKLKAVKKYLKNNLNKGFIQINSALIVGCLMGQAQPAQVESDWIR